MSSWTQSSISLDKLCEIQKPANDRTGLGFNNGESSSGETCTQSNRAYDKFKKMSFVKASVIHDPCESVRYDDQISEPLNKKGKVGIVYDRPKSSKSGGIKNRLDKEKAKAGSKSFVQNQQRRGSKKRKRRLALGSDDEIVGEPTTVAIEVAIENIVEEQRVEMPVDHVDQIIEQGTETATADPTTDKNISDDESMTLEAILYTISDDLSLPSTFGEITLILFGKSISIPGVDEGDWYKASLPKIHPADKRKAPLQGQVLSWAETDSTRIALQRKMYILTKYRELLLRKFLEIRLSNFVPGVATSSVDMKVLDMLSNLHVFVIDELKVLSEAHGLRWEMPCYSKVFEGPNRDHGTVIARSNTNIKSTCWIRTMLRINGTWVMEPCADYWQQIPRVVASSIVFIRSRLSYVDTLPPVSEFFKLLKKRWANVCIEAAQFFVSGKLLPVGSLNFCRAIAVVQQVSVFGSQRPTVTSWGWSQLCTAFDWYILFSGLSTVDIRNFVSTLALNRSVLRDVQLVTHSVSVAPSVHTSIALVVNQFVQIDTSSVFEDQKVLRDVQLVTHSVSVAPSVHTSIALVVNQFVQIDTSSVFEDQNAQMFLNQRPHSPTTSDDSSMRFDDDETASTPIYLPTIPIDLQASFAQLRASIEQLQFEPLRRKDDNEKLKDILLMHIRDLEKKVNARFDEHDREYRVLLTNICKDMHDHKTALSLDIFRYHQKLST
ncbi:hypothetical protein F511_32352 [Dorcoceras hygrometricum]|uniref:Uncharacterized protein n=1 Tax=Dorcoceras hygrometricum TaxID=472368 RepID=A0A2Z7DI33_9LAMI|nr:hypothetical protein F511_32352 [Dorcoceras hygrometricum]